MVGLLRGSPIESSGCQARVVHVPCRCQARAVQVPGTCQARAVKSLRAVHFRCDWNPLGHRPRHSAGRHCDHRKEGAGEARSCKSQRRRGQHAFSSRVACAASIGCNWPIRRSGLGAGSAGCGASIDSTNSSWCAWAGGSAASGSRCAQCGGGGPSPHTCGGRRCGACACRGGAARSRGRASSCAAGAGSRAASSRPTGASPRTAGHPHRCAARCGFAPQTAAVKRSISVGWRGARGVRSAPKPPPGSRVV
jgi:hypothetical protein